MQKKIVLGCFLVSIVMIAVGLIWRAVESQNASASLLYTFGWLLSLLVMGYYCTPTGKTFGKIAFAAIIILVVGIGMKAFAITGANKVIVGALLTLAITYAKMWMKAQKISEDRKGKARF
jgi:hypothetical protein